MNSEVQQIITELSKLKLSEYPYKEAKELINRFKKFGCVSVTLHEGKTILRARPNNNEESFTSKCQLTYKPQQFNNTFQRASTPKKTMFYGSFTPESVQSGEINEPVVICTNETLPLFRDKKLKGLQKITYGYWEVKKEINLIAIVQYDGYHRVNSYAKILGDEFNEFMSDDAELATESKAIFDFFAKEFAKEGISNDYEYLLSACFTEVFVEGGIDGILYPSVQSAGQGINVAIKPEIADTNLELISVRECSAYKYGDHTYLDNDRVISLKPNQTNFELLPVEQQYHAGEEQILKELGLSSIEELKET